MCLILVLDLDETLVFASAIKPQGDSIAVKVGRRRMFVRMRPGVVDLIKQISALFEVFFFTASSREYANQIIDAIAPDTPESHRFFRESCVTRCGYPVKDLRLLERPMSRILIVDDMEGSALMQPKNLIRVSPWYGDDNDKVLIEQLMPVLLGIACEADLPTACLRVMDQQQFPELFTSQLIA